MSRQAAKIALVTINGKGVPCNPEGTSLELGGYTREAVAADLNPNAAFSKTPKASKLVFQAVSRADFDALEPNTLEGAEVLVEYDNGLKYKMANATTATDGKKDGADVFWSFEMFGDPCEKV